MSELVVDAVTVRRAGATLLDKVSLRVARGELVALVGPNGAGKTTLLRAGLGLLPLAAGRVTLGGADAVRMRARDRAAVAAWLPQHALATTEPLPARELVAAARYRFDEAPAASLHAAAAALARVGAAAFADRDVLALSGGERQRVALAALLAQDAPLLLLDEPATHLDPARQGEVYALLGGLWREGLGILCVTHDLNVLAHLGRPDAVRVVGLADGRIRFERPYDAADLPEQLSALFGVPMETLANGAHRVIVPRVGAV